MNNKGLSVKGMFFEDFEIGQEFITVSRTITEADIVLHSGLSGDHNLIHTDENFARQAGFKGRIAHGHFTLAVMIGLESRLHLTERAIAFLGIDKLKFTAPVYPGDTIRSELEVVGKRETKKAGRGIITIRSMCKNQKGEVVLEGEFTYMLPIRGNNPRSALDECS